MFYVFNFYETFRTINKIEEVFGNITIQNNINYNINVNLQQITKRN